MKDNIFARVPVELNSELFEVLVQNDNVRIERIVSSGHSSPDTGWYDQAQNEWVILLQGEATIVFDEGASVDLEAGDYLNIPARSRHRVSSTSVKPEAVWLAVHYDGKWGAEA